MWRQLLLGGAVSFLNFGVHALFTGFVIGATRRMAEHTDHLRAHLRLAALLAVTMIYLMIAHVCEIGVWAFYYDLAGIHARKPQLVRLRLRELHRARLR